MKWFRLVFGGLAAENQTTEWLGKDIRSNRRP